MRFLRCTFGLHNWTPVYVYQRGLVGHRCAWCWRTKGGVA